MFVSPDALAQSGTATCNTVVALTNPSFTNLTVTSSQGIGGDEFNNKANLIDNDPTFTTAATYTSILTSSAWVQVKDNNATGANVYATGSFAGFIINTTSLAATITITTYLGNSNTAVDTKIFNNLADVGILGSKTRIGLIATGAFDRVRIEYGGVVGTVSVYAPVIERFCDTAPALACNTLTTLTSPTVPVYVNPDNTGFGGVLNLGSITNVDNAVSANPTDYASINLTAGVGTTATFSIKNSITEYPGGSFAGIDVASPALLDLGVLNGISIRTYNNGVLAQTIPAASLLSANTSITSGLGRRVIGFITAADKPFDEIRLTVTKLVAAGVEETRVYGFVVEKFCAGPSVACADNTIPQNTLTPLVAPTSPVYVDGNNTGFPGAACVACAINNSANVIDTDLTNFATVVLTAGVSTSATFAVANAVDTYPVNSFAGFDIQTNSVVSAAVVGSATISLYNNGALVQTGTGNAIIVGATTALLNGVTRQIVGIVATVPYDEVKITIPSLVGVNLGTINIYSAIFEKTCAAAIVCNTAYNLSNPTFPVVIDAARTGVTGVVSAATTIRDPWNVVSASTTDFATITNLATVATNASIAVLDPISTYPVGTFAGFSVRKVSGLVLADLFGALTVSTYNDGVLQESRTGNGSLLDLSITLFGSTSTAANVGFITTRPFDEIQLTVAPLVGVGVLGGNLDVFGAFVDTRTSTGGGLVCALNTNPDFAVTNKNVPATGSVKTNDLVPAGTTYGPAPTATTQPNGSSPSLTVNSDGTYTFVSATPGVYVYSVPVCGSGLSGTACATQTLTITVLDPTINTNKPVANPDIVTTTGAASNPSAVTINVKANDGPGNAGGTLGVPTITTPPTNGSATVDGSGNVVYTPNANFYGTDVLTYQVCETPGSNLCATATVTITVKAPGSTNTTVAADDYISTYQGLAASGNVKTNDSDPEGNTQTVTAQTTTIAGKGTLVVTSAGSYTFTPVAGATGPVDFSYTTTDSGSPAASANGTLHVLINPFNPNPDFVVTNKGVPATGSVKTNDVIPVGATYGPAPAPASAPGGSAPTLTVNTDGTFTFSSATPGVYVYNVPVCAPTPPTYCTTQTLTITVLDPAVTTNPPVANPDFATVTGSPTTPAATTINVKVNDGPGNSGGTLGTPTIATGPAHGTASIDGTGNVVYTPTAGYYGTDVLTYQVCETPSNCATATVSITVKAPGTPANVSINDDYVSTAGVTPATGNVLTNDLGNTLTVSNPGTTSTSSGTLVLTATGSYTFTPAPGVTGPVDFTYTACDNSTPSVCGSATLHVLVGQSTPDLSPIIRLPLGNFTASGENATRDFVVEVTEYAGQATSSGNVKITITAPLGYNLTYNNALTSINVSGGTTNPVAVDNTKWTAASTSERQLTVTINAGQFISANGKATLGFTISRAAASKGTANLTVNVNDDASKTYDSNPLNNIYVRNVNAL
ncbi:Ig-like domain-containing protein [Spirosoma radiotolerans]|uniref:Tandem-95 repeat protein n=1 Tax=Spirosoma radiotolerans TaxID=1379870 RepID=A0A0E3ZUI5_9BACT|nr:Ig-like domain-containing protein [Spirosoma radiotolerans]AKD54568.1 hypothetical protein SD10_06240 [Spirosoma radiotolerans]